MVVIDEIDVKDSKEFWNVYKLEDGTVLRFKTILLKVVDKGLDANLKPAMGISAINAVSAKPSFDTKIFDEPKMIVEDLAFEVKTEYWNEYKLANGTTMYIKPGILQIDRSDKVDDLGIPLYGVMCQPLVKVK